MSKSIGRVNIMDQLGHFPDVGSELIPLDVSDEYGSTQRAFFGANPNDDSAEDIGGGENALWNEPAPTIIAISSSENLLR